MTMILEEVRQLSVIPDLLNIVPMQSSLLRIINNLPTHKKQDTNNNAKDQISKDKYYPKLKLKSHSRQIEFQLNQQQLFYRQRILAGMLKDQIKIMTEQMESTQQRNIIINEMVRIHYEKNLKTQILYQATSIVDRYLTYSSILKKDYLKICVVTLWMATKLLSKKVKRLERWLKHSQQSTIDDLLELESNILLTLNYELIFPSSFNFFNLLSSYFQMTKINYRLCTYILQLALVDCQFNQYSQSCIALSTIYLSFQILKLPYWNNSFITTFNVSFQTIKSCSEKLFDMGKKVAYKKQKNVYKKFSLNQNYQVSKLFN